MAAPAWCPTTEAAGAGGLVGASASSRKPACAPGRPRNGARGPRPLTAPRPAAPPAAATSGTTSVTDTLPGGLVPTGASGSGWICATVGQTVTCTTTAGVAGSAAFPAISITVNVAQSAPASVTNTTTVSGGGEVNTANDTASDPTNVVSRADIAVAKLASSGTVVVGSNVTYTITATNNGPSDATGVQVTDQLPG